MLVDGFEWTKDTIIFEEKFIDCFFQKITLKIEANDTSLKKMS